MHKPDIHFSTGKKDGEVSINMINESEKPTAPTDNKQTTTFDHILDYTILNPLNNITFDQS